MKSRVLSLLLVGLLAAGAVLGACRSAGSQAGSPAPRVGKTAPDFALRLLDGRMVALSDFRGKPVLLNFWTTWCPACRVEMPYLESVFQREKEQGLTILAVDIEEIRDTVVQFTRQYGLSFPVALDTSGDVARQYRVSTLPTTFLIDKEGTIRLVKIGAFSDEAEILERLKAIMP